VGIIVRWAWGKRDGMKSIRARIARKQLDMEMLVWTRGRVASAYRKLRTLRSWSKIMLKDVNQKKLDEEMKRQKLDMELDQELEATFPASDALKITRTDSLTRFSRPNRRT
jgi:hypothetical protein